MRSRKKDPAVEKARGIAIRIARALDKKKADDVVIFDLKELSVLADFFVIASGFARVQIRALADWVLEEAEIAAITPRSLEGYEDSGWILIDFSDVVVHLMTHESRDYYRLDRLWGDAPKVKWETKKSEMETE